MDFLGAQLEARMRQQPQAPKPYLDCITLRHAEYNAWISSQHQKVSAAASHVGKFPQGNARHRFQCGSFCAGFVMDFSPSGSLQLHLSAAVQLLHY